jgi:hypothetical protein
MSDPSGQEGIRALAGLPLAQLIAALGVGIADAQTRLDDNSISSAQRLADKMIDVPLPGTDEMVSRSLISLGFTPTFYHFREATIELHIELTVQFEEELDVDGELTLDIDRAPVAFGLSASVDYMRRYGVEASALATINLSLEPVPPPSEFVAWIRELDRLEPADPLPKNGRV